MNEKQARAIELAKQYENQSENLKLIREELNNVLRDIGVGEMFQDPATTTVYEVAKPKGRFVEYFDIDYNRTAVGEERSGTLSMKRAQERGFKVNK